MFEGKPPRFGDARPLEEEPWEGEALRELTWADLVARLSATRGMRAVPEDPGEAGEASFDASSARRIAAHHNGKQPVNLDDSSYGKAPQRTAFPPVMGTGFLPGAARK